MNTALPQHEVSRRYYLMLADLDAQLADLEQRPGALPAVKWLTRRRGIIEHRKTLKQLYERDYGQQKR